jgi:uncharacterized protein
VDLRVAIIGASNNRKKFSNKAVRAYQKTGALVFPVNPKEKEVEGLKSYASVLDIPGEIDVALFYVPPSIGLKLIEDVAKKGIKKTIFSPGTESDELTIKAKVLGVNPVLKCAIKAIGLAPSDFP